MKALIPVRSFRSVVLALGLVIVMGVPVFAGEIPGYPANILAYDHREVSLLPRYCIYTQGFRESVPGGNNPEEIKRWHSVMGDTFNAMHHYCWGLMNTNRATLLVRNQTDRLRYLNSSIQEFDYVIKRAPPDFTLLPEIFSKKGENLIRSGKGPHGVLELQRAIELKADYWPPYAYLSDYFKEIGDIEKAREWLEKGLSASPNTKALMWRLAELNTPQSKRAVRPPAER